jgi:hypothetical protein
MSPKANFIAGALRTFLKHLKKKMPEMEEGELFLHCENALVHSAKGVQVIPGKENIKLL